MSEERLELVREWSELRAGMLVVAICKDCPVRDRGILLRLAKCKWDGEKYDGWLVGPPLHSHFASQATLAARTVAERRVYRVVDPDADKAETTETEKPRKLVKT